MDDLLLKIFDELNRVHFADELPQPSLSWNSRLSSTAGRFVPGRPNPLFYRAPEIEVASYLRDLPDGEMHVRDTVLHEMIHYVLWFRRRPYGHTPEFHQILKRVGAKRFNPVPKVRPVKHWYECPSCRLQIPARRKMGSSACLRCCEKYNRGEFSGKFRLRLLDPSEVKAMKSTDGCTAPATGASAPAQERAPEAPKENARISPQEIVRRLEELKGLVSEKFSRTRA